MHIIQKHTLKMARCVTRDPSLYVCACVYIYIYIYILTCIFMCLCRSFAISCCFFVFYVSITCGMSLFSVSFFAGGSMFCFGPVLRQL